MKFNPEKPLGYLITPSSSTAYKLICDASQINLSFPEKSLVYGQYFVIDQQGESIPVEVLGYTSSVELENPYNNKPLNHIILSTYGDEIENISESDHKYINVNPIACINLNTKEEFTIGIPRSGTPFYFVKPGQIVHYYKNKQNIFNFGYLSGTNVPIGLDIRHFGTGENGWGDARIMGVAGKTGSGKTVLLGQLIGAYSRHREIGILILDPQGQYSSKNKHGEYTGELGKNPEFWSWQLSKFFEKTKRLQDVQVISNTEVNFGQNVELFLVLLRYHHFWETIRPGIKGEKIDLAENKLNDYLKLYLGKKHQGKERHLYELIWTNELMNKIIEMIAECYADPEKEHQQMLTRNETNENLSSQLGEIWEKTMNYFSPKKRSTDISSLVKNVLLKRKIIIFNNDCDDHYIEDLFIKTLFSTLKGEAQKLYWAAQSNGTVSNVNSLIVVDEAQRVIPEYPEKENDIKEQILKLVQDSVNTGRKLGLGWIFATQSVVNISKVIWRQVGTSFIGYGFGVGADKQRLLEIVGNNNSIIKQYETMPQPIQTGKYWFMVQGDLVAIGNGNQTFFIDCFQNQQELFCNNQL